MDFKLVKWNRTYINDVVKHVNNQKITDNLTDGVPYPYTYVDAKQCVQT